MHNIRSKLELYSSIVHRDTSHSYLASAFLCKIQFNCRCTRRYVVNDLYLHVHTRPIVCMSKKYVHMHSGCGHGHGYNGQQKYTVCDACRLCHSILSIQRPVFTNSTDSLLSYVDLQIWRFCVYDNDDDTTNFFTPVHVLVCYLQACACYFVRRPLIPTQFFQF